MSRNPTFLEQNGHILKAFFFVLGFISISLLILELLAFKVLCYETFHYVDSFDLDHYIRAYYWISEL